MKHIAIPAIVYDLVKKYSAELEPNYTTGTDNSGKLTFISAKISSTKLIQPVRIDLVRDTGGARDSAIIAIAYNGFEYTDESSDTLLLILEGILEGELVSRKTLFGLGSVEQVVTTKDGEEHWPRR